MIKKLGKLVVVCLIVIGGYNVVTLNKPVFSKIGNTLTKKSVGEIPGNWCRISPVTHGSLPGSKS